MKNLYLLHVLGAVALFSFHSDKTSEQHYAKPVIAADTTATLPRAYLNRKFLNNVSDLSTDISLIPGNICTYNPKDTTYSFRTIKGIIKDDKLPIGRYIADGTIYLGRLTPKTSFNGSYLIGGVAAGKNEILEISIKDVAIYTVPDSLVDIEKIKAVVKNESPDVLKNLVYIKGVTLSYVDYTTYTAAKFNPLLNTNYLTSDGKTYVLKDRMRSESLVSVWAVPLTHLFDH